MTLIQAVVLGAVQGIAEFLPISSSGHLAIAEYLFGYTEIPIIFDILLHIATLGAVCLVFYQTLWRLLQTTGRFIIRKNTDKDRADLQLIAALLISTALTGVIGIALKDIVHAKNIHIIAVCFIITGAALFFSSKVNLKKNSSVPSILQAAIIGCAQGIGVLPGISRSGSTITAALFTGMNREKAGEFSFLLSIPAILAAFIFEVKSADTIGGQISSTALAAGMLTAFAVGVLALKVLIKLIKQGRFGVFAYYLIPVGIVLLIAA